MLKWPTDLNGLTRLNGPKAEGYFPPSEAFKSTFFFNLTKLNSNIQPNVSIKKISEIFKSTRDIEKNVFQIKVKLHAGVKISNKEVAVKPKLAKLKLKMRFPFLHAWTSLDTRTLKIASNCDLESCLSVRCLAPQNIFQFFHFCRGLCVCLWQLCSLLCRPPQCFTKRSRSWSIVIDVRRSRCSIGFRFQVSASWCGAICLRTFMRLSLLFDSGRNTTTLSEFIG